MNTHFLLKKGVKIIGILCGLFLLVGLTVQVWAERERHRGGDHGNRGKEKSQREKHFRPVSNPTYQNTCGGCHLAYPPGLLPSGSWEKILNRLQDHFGEAVSCEATEQKAIRKYLIENGADRSSGKKSVKIMECLKGTTPRRITEIPYIQRKHRRISKAVFSRNSIGSLSNCRACHQTADQGIFDDEYVVIPE